MKKVNTQFEIYIQGETEIAKQKLNHRNIVQILEHFTENKIYIVMEYCEKGNLNDYIVQEKPELCQRISFLCDMAYGVNYLHSQNIIHRDLKPENVLLTNHTGNIICKISDFGISRIKLSSYDTFRTYIGSYPYMAPEITGRNEYSIEVDVFALGLLFYAVFKNTVLTNSFGGTSLIPGIYIHGNRIAYLNEEMKKENTNEEEFLEKYFKDSSSFGKFIFSMLNMEPEGRPKMDIVLSNVTELKVKHQLNPIIHLQKESIRDLDKQNEDLKKNKHLAHENLEREELKFSNLTRKKNKIVKKKIKITAGLQNQISGLHVELETLNLKLKQHNQQKQKLVEQSQEERKIIQDEFDQRETEKEHQLRNLIAKHKQKKTELKKLTETLQEAVKQKKVTRENIEKEGNFKLKELQDINETFKKEREYYIQTEKEQSKTITELKNKSATIQEEIIKVRKEYFAKRKALQDVDAKKDYVINTLQNQNTDLERDVKEKEEHILTMQGNIHANRQERVKLRHYLNKKDKEILIIRETLDGMVQKRLTEKEQINQKDLAILSLREMLDEKDKNILLLERDMKENLEIYGTTKEILISNEKSLSNDLTICHGELKKKEAIIGKFETERIKQGNLLLNQMIQFKDEQRQLGEDLECKMVIIGKMDKKIEELYNRIGDLQHMMCMPIKLAVLPNEKKSEQEKQNEFKSQVGSGELNTEPSLATRCISNPEEKDLKSIRQIAPLRGSASHKDIMYISQKKVPTSYPAISCSTPDDQDKQQVCSDPNLSKKEVIS